MSEKLKVLLKNGEFIKGIEFIDSWPIGLYESLDMSVTNNLGVQIVWLEQYTVELEEIEKEVFVVSIETVSEIVNWNQGEPNVLYEIVENPTYELGEFEVVEVFETYDAAYNYATVNHPVVDLEKLIKLYARKRS